MIVKVDDVTLYELKAIQKQVIQNDINADTFESDMHERLFYILNHKYNQCFKRLKTQWEPILTAEGAESLPTDPDAFAALVFAHDDYKDKKTREAEAVQI